jgi:hypothetical protein
MRWQAAARSRSFGEALEFGLKTPSLREARQHPSHPIIFGSFFTFLYDTQPGRWLRISVDGRGAAVAISRVNIPRFFSMPSRSSSPPPHGPRRCFRRRRR